MSEKQRQQFVMMGPGFGDAIGNAFIFFIWLAAAGWAVAIVVGLLWWLL